MDNQVQYLLYVEVNDVTQMGSYSIVDVQAGHFLCEQESTPRDLGSEGILECVYGQSCAKILVEFNVPKTARVYTCVRYNTTDAPNSALTKYGLLPGSAHQVDGEFIGCTTIINSPTAVENYTSSLAHPSRWRSAVDMLCVATKALGKNNQPWPDCLRVGNGQIVSCAKQTKSIVPRMFMPDCDEAQVLAVLSRLRSNPVCPLPSTFPTVLAYDAADQVVVSCKTGDPLTALMQLPEISGLRGCLSNGELVREWLEHTKQPFIQHMIDTCEVLGMPQCTTVIDDISFIIPRQKGEEWVENHSRALRIHEPPQEYIWVNEESGKEEHHYILIRLGDPKSRLCCSSVVGIQNDSVSAAVVRERVQPPTKFIASFMHQLQIGGKWLYDLVDNMMDLHITDPHENINSYMQYIRTTAEAVMERRVYAPHQHDPITGQAVDERTVVEKLHDFAESVPNAPATLQIMCRIETGAKMAYQMVPLPIPLLYPSVDHDAIERGALFRAWQYFTGNDKYE